MGMNFWARLKEWCVGPPSPPRETKDAGIVQTWTDYWGLHIALDKGSLAGIRESDTFFIIHPTNKVVVTHPETQEVLTTYYRNAFKVRVDQVNASWARCFVTEDSDKAYAQLMPSEGNIAVYQYNLNDWFHNQKPIVLRFP